MERSISSPEGFDVARLGELSPLGGLRRKPAAAEQPRLVAVSDNWGATPGGSSDVVLCADVVAYIDRRSGCCDLP
jgi:hypothetical protein